MLLKLLRPSFRLTKDGADRGGWQEGMTVLIRHGRIVRLVNCHYYTTYFVNQTMQ